MARRIKKKKAKKSTKSDFGLSDGVRQSILAVALIAIGVILLLSFFEMAGKIGTYFELWLSLAFGWGRWFFALILVALGWMAVFPGRRTLSRINIIGVIFFFLSFDSFLNLVMADGSRPETADIIASGGYIGLIVGNFLAGMIGFWGAIVVSVAVMLIAVFLIFNISLDSILTVHSHFTGLGRVLHRRQLEGSGDEDEEEEVVRNDEVEEEPEEDDEEEKKGKGRIFDTAHDPEPEESLMTSSRRRKIKIPLDLLDDKSSKAKPGDIERNKSIIDRTFSNFGIEVDMAEVRVGPTVTQYALRPSQGVKLSRIVALNNDLALALAAHPIRIEAPIPGKSLVGIEVPNQSVGRVCLRELLASKDFKERKTDFTAPLGKDVAGGVHVLAIDKAPHTLVAGATGSGKSVCLNTIILSLLYQSGPDDLKFIMVDPKRVELGVYAGIPHLLVPPITKVDDAINALKWAVREMERRLDHLAKNHARDIDSYNAKAAERMPKIIIIIDELADLMSQNKRDVEAVIVRIAQMARAAGIHLVLATQRPSVDVITGIIKANIPTRMAFAVASQVDSKTILDMGGAEKLLGRGDMLLTTPAISKPKRLQGAFVSDQEIQRVVDFLKKQGEPDYNYQVTEDTRTGGTVFDSSDTDPLLNDAIKVVIESGKASTSFLQRRLQIGYSRAARIIDIMEEMGVVGGSDGAKARGILVESWPPGGENGERDNPVDVEDDEEDFEEPEDIEEPEEDEDEDEGYIDDIDEDEDEDEEAVDEDDEEDFDYIS
ncbi:MAG: DNA translocase FtsK 4TM domain-containing protein [Candidatus Uhrbacteria bacterium]|nr:DNA translocase FtsK 4TM domain-containing protein [Candidatus Uhrbacteria bacterium]